MINRPNEHKFEFNLPMHPHEHVGADGMPCKLKMDGRQMDGVQSLTIRAGTNGFTNVVIDFEASCAVECAAHLVAHMVGFSYEEQQYKLAEIFRDVDAEIQAELEPQGACLSHEIMAQAQFVRRIIEMTLERIK